MSTANVLYRVRRMLGDIGAPFTAGAAGNGVAQMFDLNAAPVEPTSVVVMTTTNNGVSWVGPLTFGSQYSIDGYNGKIIFPTPPQTGTYISIQGLAHTDWNDVDLTDFIAIAMAQHTYHRNPPVYLDAVTNAIPPTQLLPQVEENLVAILAVIEAYWALATAKSQNFTIDTGDGTVIPLPQQYEHIMAHVDRLTERYERMSNLLGVGLYAIEMATLRRVSRITGCLVPIYVEQELEQRWHPPDRALPPIPQVANVQIHFRGIWDSDDTYNVNDEVLWGGYTYVALTQNSNIPPDTDVANGVEGVTGANWKLTTINSFGGFQSGYWW